MTDSGNSPDLYLASASPRRRALLTQIGVRFAVLPVAVEERRTAGETVENYVRRLALEKARAGWQLLVSSGRPLAPVLGADTLGVCEDHVLEKPVDAEDAAAMLRRMSGSSHRVLTAVALVQGQREALELSETQVDFRKLSDEEIARYWRTGEPRDKAGGYAIQGLGGVFVKAIHGSYSAVVGLPLEATAALLTHFDVPWWQIAEGDINE